MHIGVLCPTFPPNVGFCGIGDYTRCLVDSLAPHSVEITLLTGESCGAKSTSGFRVIRGFSAWSPRTLQRLIRTIRKNAIEVLNVQFAPHIYQSLGWLSLVPWTVGIPTIVSFHGLTGDGPAGRLTGPILLAAARASIITNEEIASTVSRRLARWASQSRLIPIGTAIPPGRPLSTKRRAQQRSSLGISPDEVAISHFGLIYPGKGTETLFGALATLEFPWKVLMIGETPEGRDTEYSKSLRTKAESEGIADRISWLGHLDEMSASNALRATDIYAMPYDEGFSIRRSSYLAGLAHDLPVISTTPAVPTRYVTHGKNIMIVPPHDSEALARAIEDLAGAPDLRAELVEAASNLKAVFSWEAIATDTMQVFREALSTGVPAAEHA